MHAMQSYLNSFSCFVENNSKTTARVVVVSRSQTPFRRGRGGKGSGYARLESLLFVKSACLQQRLNDLVSSWLLLYVFTKTMHKTHEMITQTQKDHSSCFDDVMQLQALPDIAHSGLYAVDLDVKKQQTALSTFASIQHVRIQSPL